MKRTTVHAINDSDTGRDARLTRPHQSSFQVEERENTRANRVYPYSMVAGGKIGER